MRLFGSENSEPKPRRRKKPSVAAQPLFVPLMTAWGAALAGLSVAVLPDSAISQLTQISALGVLGGFARMFFIALAAALGGAALYFVATKWRNSLPGSPNAMVSKVAERVKPIDPISELGSESLDAPIEDAPVEENIVVSQDAPEDELLLVAEAPDEEVPEVAEAQQQVDEDDTLELSLDTICEAEEDTKPAREPHLEPAQPELAPRPRRARGRKDTKRIELVHALTDHMARKAAEAKAAEALIPKSKGPAHDNDPDLGAYNQVPPAAQPSRFTVASEQARSIGSATDKLRAVPAQELSLVQMVERLAVALHDHQEASRLKPQSDQRDAALAEALKTLSMFTQQGFNAEVADATGTDMARQASPGEDPTQVELREALGKLQTLRGAA